MFKNNKIMQLWLLSLAVGGASSPALAKTSGEETLVVTPGTVEDPNAPVNGIVATKTL